MGIERLFVLQTHAPTLKCAGRRLDAVPLGLTPLSCATYRALKRARELGDDRVSRPIHFPLAFLQRKVRCDLGSLVGGHRITKVAEIQAVEERFTLTKENGRGYKVERVDQAGL